MAKKEAPKVNPKDFGFDEKSWEKIGANFKSWMVLNKELWKDLTGYEQRALATSKDFVKTTKKASDSAKETRNLAREHAKAFKAFSKDSKSNFSFLPVGSAGFYTNTIIIHPVKVTNFSNHF